MKKRGYFVGGMVVLLAVLAGPVIFSCYEARHVASAQEAPTETPTPTPTSTATPTPAGKVVFVNNTSGSARRLHITTTTSLLHPLIAENAPGCSKPIVIATGFEFIEIVWDSPCVDPGESVSVVTCSCLYISYFFSAMPPTLTIVQPQLAPANSLHVALRYSVSYQQGGPQVTVNAPGCPAPAVSGGSIAIDVTWDVPCVDQGEAVTLLLIRDQIDPSFSFSWAYIDKDQDGCGDAAEQQTAAGSEVSGGRRDRTNFWDFFDVWTHPAGMPLAWERNKTVNLDEIYAIAMRFATNGNPNGNPLTPPVNDTSYHVAYDRTLPSPNAWNSGPPDGAIGLNEIYWVAAQFAHNCT